METEAPGVTSRFDRCLKELSATSFLADESTPDSFASMLAYYRSRTRQKRIAFRAASIMLMALGAALPAVAAFGDHLKWTGWEFDKNIAVSVMSAAIAFLTGMHSHFRWEVGWRGQTEALFALKAEKTAWENAVVVAKLHLNDDEALKFIMHAFEQLRTRVFEITRDERGKFFKAAQPPTVRSMS